MKMSAESITAKRRGMAEIFRESGVQLAFLFGSMVDAAGTPSFRDIDIAVQMSPYSFDAYLRLNERLSKVLGVKTDDIDLVVLNRANPRLKMEALLKGDPLFVANWGALNEFAAHAFFEYEDYRWFKRGYMECLTGRVKKGLSMAERRLDRERVEGYLSTMDEAVEQLATLRTRFASFDEFYGARDTRELCVHYLRIALESLLDICRHFLAVKGVSLAEIDTTNLVELAGERGLLDPRFARRIRGMAGMRNAIVHVYWRLDYQAIYEVISQRLGDFDEFARQVQDYVSRSPSP